MSASKVGEGEGRAGHGEEGKGGRSNAYGCEEAHGEGALSVRSLLRNRKESTHPLVWRDFLMSALSRSP